MILAAAMSCGYGMADNDVSDFKHFVSGGVGFEGCFGRDDDLLAIGCAWADPSDDTLSSETIVEAFIACN